MRKSAISFAWLVLAWFVLFAAYLWAGHPASCQDPEHPSVPPCNMKACHRYTKDGKPSGSRCNHYCNSKGICCRCPQGCNSDPAYNPDEEGQAALNSGRVD